MSILHVINEYSVSNIDDLFTTFAKIQTKKRNKVAVSSVEDKQIIGWVNGWMNGWVMDSWMKGWRQFEWMGGLIRMDGRTG